MELNFKSFGQGDPIVILHGMFGSLDNWQFIAKKLAEEYMVFIIDQRNHGRSPHSDEFGYDIMAEDLREFMEANWLHKAHLVGHSMGGKVVMKFAQEFPDMVDKLVVVDMAPKAYEPSHEAILDAILSLDLKSISSRSEAENFLAERITENDTLQFLLKNIYFDRETEQYLWRMNIPVIKKHYQEILEYWPVSSPYEGATLFMKGANSNYILNEELAIYQASFPNSKIDNIANAGHWVHAEQPAAFLDSLQKFLAQ